MKKLTFIILGLLSISNIIDSFGGNSDTEQIFGIEINIWLFRLVWTFVIVVIFYEFLNKKKVNK